MLFEFLKNYTSCFYGLFLTYVLYLAYNKNTKAIGYAFLFLFSIFFVPKNYHSFLVILSIILTHGLFQYSILEPFQDGIDYDCAEIKMKYEGELDAKDKIIADRKADIKNLKRNHRIEMQTLNNNVTELRNVIQRKDQKISQKNSRIQRLKGKRNALRQYKKTVFNMSRL